MQVKSTSQRCSIIRVRELVLCGYACAAFLMPLTTVSAGAVDESSTAPSDTVGSAPVTKQKATDPGPLLPAKRSANDRRPSLGIKSDSTAKKEAAPVKKP